jgi:hypothetical protein
MLLKNCAIYGCLIVLASQLAGCGHKPKAIDPNRAPASGTVTFDGKPLKGGSISFYSVKDPTSYMRCNIKPDGTFVVTNAPLGDVLVAVETDTAKFSNPDGYVRIPQKYTNIKTSGLKATIGRGSAEGQKEAPKLSFDLKSK